MSTTAPTLLDALDAAGLLDPTWKLPLGAGGGRDNIAHNSAVAIALEKPEDRQAWRTRVSYFLLMAEVPQCHGQGLYYRERGNPDSSSYDNLIGICVASVLLGTPHAGWVYDWGRRHGFCYNVEHPESYSPHHDYNRFIGAPAFIKMAAGKRVWLSQWECAQAIEASLEPHNPDKTDVGNKLLMWLWKQGLKGRSRYLDIWWRWWEREMRKQYPGGLEEFLGYYFKPVNGKEHPFTAASRGRGF